MTIVDYTLERPLALELMEMECAGVAVAWTLATTGADAGQSVEVYAQDAMSMRIAAKVECQIDRRQRTSLRSLYSLFLLFPCVASAVAKRGV